MELAFDNIHNTDLNANSWANNRNGVKRNTLVDNDAGGSLGGPIRKNKTFFFGLFEASINHSKSSVTSTTSDQQRSPGHFPLLSRRPGRQRQRQHPNRGSQRKSHLAARGDGLTAERQSVRLDPNRLAPDTSGIVAKNLALLPSPNNFLAAGDGLNTAGYVWRRVVHRRHLLLDHARRSQLQ